ncbi:hypothetical protein SAMN04488029_3858 [Reichenbachiella faecimaris]|uniref:Uncharacterized protein n=2 Tax=Reichenbachiella faecimaris TaxID=692418 RepID=A0A1W2GQ56_REIFA|nr:hypothetical protein SAMN04488029_3858 [Reichenbachiella faecimaris]
MELIKNYMRFIITVLLFTTCLFGYAQNSRNFVFRVLASKGANQVEKADGKKVHLRPGITLMQGDQIIASKGAYIGLMHRTGKTIELRAPGVTKISDIETQLANSKSSVASKYANYVLSKINDDGDNSNYRRNMKATGAVERASGTAISAMLPSSVNILNPAAVIRWNTVGENAYYVITVRNIFDEELISAETTKPYMQINLDDENLASEELIILNIKVKDNPDLFSPDYGIERLSEEKATEINTSLAQLKAEISGETPLGKLVLASYFEDNNLILDALTQYEAIMEQAPDVEDFKMLYGEFLIRNGLSKLEE